MVPGTDRTFAASRSRCLAPTGTSCTQFLRAYASSNSGRVPGTDGSWSVAVRSVPGTNGDSDLDQALGGGAQRLVLLREAESQHRAAGVLVEERRHRNRRHAVLDDQAMRDLLVGLLRDRRVIEQLEVGAGARQRAESRSAGQLQEQIALLLVERRQRPSPTDRLRTNSAKAICDGVCTVKVMNWCTRVTSAISGCGPTQ